MQNACINEGYMDSTTRSIEISAREPLTVYHIEGRRSMRIAWLCEELGLPYRLVYQRGDLMGSMKLIRAHCPLMPVAPAIKYGEDVIVESGAILQLLQARHGSGRFAPDVESPDYPFHLQWLHFAEGTLGARFAANFGVSQALHVTPDTLPKGYRAGSDPNAPEIVGPVGVFEYMEDFLARRPYFGGAEFSIADISMHGQIRFAKLVAWIHVEDYPHVAAWRRTVEARDAFVRATQASTPSGADEFGMPVGISLYPFVPPPPRN
jgi:glutathione S-transferase